MSDFFRDKVVLITGGTGSFGRACARILLDEYAPEKVIVFSRDELKQLQMSTNFDDRRMRFFIGDIRDRERLYRAFEGVDIVVHAAALKQVPVAEYNPLEAIRTNIDGAANVIDAALDRGVTRIIALSTDKAVSPINLYGATKLCSDKLFTAANSYAGKKDVRFAVVRYGNVLGSRGSVVPVFRELRSSGELPITDQRMTRFFIPLDRAVRFVLECTATMTGGEVFVPKIPSTRIVDLARAMAPECRLKEIGIRPGEKLHETLLTHDEARQTVEFDTHFVIQPRFPWWDGQGYCQQTGGRRLPEDFEYCSDANPDWFSTEELRRLTDDGSGSLPSVRSA